MLARYLDRSLLRRVYLDREDFRILREEHGLSRAAVERALAELERARRVRLIAHRGDVLVALPIGRRP